MMQRLLLLGLNHMTAPLEVREKLAFNAAEARAAVEALRARFPSWEAVLLSTCNRVELYTAREGTGAGPHHPPPAVQDLVEFLAGFHGVPAPQFREHVYHKTGKDVVEHLFTVSSALDSMVLGETQILGQVRDAYDGARRVGATGPLLHPLFQRALSVGKQVMHETALGDGRLSVASVAVDYAKRIFEHFSDKTVLSIGAGKMAALVLQSFAGLQPGRLMVCNRDPAKAAVLATRFRGEPVPFERLGDHLVAADIVLTSTGSCDPVITRAAVEGLLKRRRYRPMFLIDIAVPRDVEASVGELERVYLYNLDDLQQVVQGTLSQRKGAIDAARAIVNRHIEEFSAWHRQREMGPAIDRLYRTFHDLAREELDRTLNKLSSVSPADRAQLEEMTRRLVNKMLHRPVQTLRNSEGMHAVGTYLHAMEKLFHLEPAEGGQEPAPPDPGAAPADGEPPAGP